MRPVKHLLRFLLLSLLLLYFTAAATMLTVRYWVLPRINEWRPQVEQHLSEALGAKVSIEELSANWSGLNPTLSVRQLSVHDSDGDALIQVPDAFAIVSWKSLLEFDLRLTRLEVNGVDLAATRHLDGTISVAGHRLVAHSNEQLKLDRDTLAVRWLLDQGEIFIRQAQLRWTDQVRQAPVLNLSQIDLSLTNSLFRHELRLVASLPDSVGRQIEVVAKTENSLSQLAPHPKREAEIYLAVQEIQVAALAPWIDLPEVSGVFAARVWIDVQQGLLGQAVLELSGKKIGLPLALNETAALFAQTGQMRLTGWLADLLPDARWPLLARSANQQGVVFSATTSELKMDSDLFAPSELILGDVTARAKIFKTSTGELSIDSAQLDLKSPELAAQLQGSWVSDQATTLGRINLTGLVSKAPVNKVHQYL
ncbi:MAG: AsmA family protein, partial [Alcaligenaceae bacterium]